MKKITFLSILLIANFFSCKNFDIDHPDYGYISGYFPYQFPVRTLILGDYIYDNSNDNAHKFLISIGIGGVYINEKDRTFNIQVDNSLCDNIYFSESGRQIKALPPDYYQLSDNNKIIVKKGEFNGAVVVQLTDAFFSDPDAIINTYVVPVRIIGSNDVDTILSGESPKPNADPRIASDWNITPKNFTMFAVKYINEFHGTYFHYGSNSVKDFLGNVIETNSYSEQYVENNTLVKLQTTGQYQVSLSTFFESVTVDGALNMILTFNGDKCTVTAADNSPYTINGTGEFQSKKYTWGNKERDGIILKYSVTLGNYLYEAEETLVIRDRSVVMEVFTPVIL